MAYLMLRTFYLVPNLAFHFILLKKYCTSFNVTFEMSLICLKRDIILVWMQNICTVSKLYTKFFGPSNDFVIQIKLVVALNYKDGRYLSNYTFCLIKSINCNYLNWLWNKVTCVNKFVYRLNSDVKRKFLFRSKFKWFVPFPWNLNYSLGHFFKFNF